MHFITQNIYDARESFPIENMQNGVTSKYVHLKGTHSQWILLYST